MGRRDIEIAIAVEGRPPSRRRVGPGRQGRAQGRECARAVVEQDRQGVGAEVVDHKVGISVAIEISRRDAPRADSVAAGPAAVKVRLPLLSRSRRCCCCCW